MGYCKLGQIITVHSQFIHADEGMDGEAVCLAFALAKAKHTNQSGPVVVATTTGPDWLRDVIKQYGIRLKVSVWYQTKSVPKH